MRLSPSDFRALSVFRSLVEHRGFGGAQVALGMGQSTISFHLKSLEERLGFQLCHRGRQGFELTDRGKQMYRESDELMAAIAGFERKLGELRHQIDGKLRIGVVDNTLTDPRLAIHDAIRVCYRRAPEVDIQLLIGTPETLVADLSRGDLDLAITPRIDFVSGLRQASAYEESHSLYCGRGHPLHRGDRRPTVAEVERHPFVIRPYAGRRELLYFPGAAIGAYASNMEAQARFILSGALLGYLPEHFAARWVEAGDIRPVLSPETRIQSDFVILTNGDSNPPPLHRLFVQELLRNLPVPPDPAPRAQKLATLPNPLADTSAISMEPGKIPLFPGRGRLLLSTQAQVAGRPGAWRTDTSKAGSTCPS